MADLVTPIVDIISRLWPCCARHTSYLCKLQENQISLRTAMNELKNLRNDVQRRVIEEERDLNEPKKRKDSVSGWLENVEKFETEVEVILQKADEEQRSSRGRCLGGCCPPPNKCWRNYKLGKSIAKKIPMVVELKGKGNFQELTFVVARPTNYLSILQDNKILLGSAMDELKNVRNDVQRKVVEAEADQSEPKMRTDQVRGWLQSVENIERQVEVILQTSDEQLSNAECHEKDKLVVMKMASVGELKGKGNFEVVTYRLPPPSVQPMNLESTVGMESTFDKVWKHITSKDDNKGNIIGLYGQGGVGKTTLLKKLNNEFNKISGEHGFDHIVMFVVVSQPINYEAIQNKIGERLGLKNSLKGDGDESSRADKIFNQLRNKSFVILLDDIWKRVDLQHIGIPQGQGQGGSSSSKVIFTTRSKEVCGQMEATQKFQVDCLPWDKAWRLFQDKVGEEALTSFQGARELAEDVAKRCGGLPLALITIGRAMSTTKSADEWKDAITTLRNSASEFPGMSDDILPRLKLSYDNLRNDTFKSCFLYCALYPEDHRIYVPELIDYWIAEGILNRSSDNNNLDEARCYGHLVIETLKRACLLESCEKETEVKMHDIIRDLALWIVNDCKSNTTTGNKFLVASSKVVVCERWRNAERIFWNTPPRSSSMEVEEPPKSLNLRTLLVQPGSHISLPQNFFQFTPSLRVLDMSRTYLQELPTSICELYELQYLNLSSTNIRELPVELGKLVKLKFLDLTYATYLVKIPPGVIANLSQLQVLKLAGSRIMVRVLKEEEDGDGDGDGGLSLGEVDRLKQLQEVTLKISTSLAALEDLLMSFGELDRICTALELESCVNLKSFSLPPPKRGGGLGNFRCLRELRILGCVELEELILFINNNEGGAAAAGLPINSNNNNKLERLSLNYLPKLNNIVWEWGEKYHHYMAAAQQQQQQQHYLHYYASPFQNLHSINIYICHALKDLTWVAYVESLKSLSVERCYGLETIIVELGGDDDGGLEEKGTSGGGGGGGGRVFRRLKTLYMWGLPKLKSICSHALLFPSIVEITIVRCPALKKLPLDSRSNINNTLQGILGEEEWWSELQWEDETIKSKFLPYFKKR